MTDKELVIYIKKTDDPEAITTLWDRYSRMVHKHWAILRKQLSNSHQVMGVEEDFYSEAFISFRKALDAIDTSKIKNDKWKFLGYFRFYLQNLRASFITKIRATYEHEKPFYVVNRDGEEMPLIDLIQSVQDRDSHRYSSVEQIEASIVEEQVITSCMELWDNTRQKIFTMKANGLSNSEVAKKMDVHPATITYYLHSMKKDVDNFLQT